MATRRKSSTPQRRTISPVLTTNAAGHKVGAGYSVACGKLEWQTQPYVSSLPPDNPSHPRLRRRCDSFCRLDRTALPDEDIDESPHEVFVYELGAVRQPTAMKVFTVEPYYSGTYDPQSTGGQVLPHSHYLPATTLTDALGRPVQRLRHTVVNGQLVSMAGVTMSYDVRGLLTRRHVPYITLSVDEFAAPAAAVGFEQFTHDALGRVIEQTNPDGSVRRWNHDIAWQTAAEDECYADSSCRGGRSVERSDSGGRIVEKEVYTESDAGDVLAAKTAYTYDTFGHLVSSQQWNGAAWNPATTIVHAYDSLGRRIALDDPDSGSWRYGYDAVGNLRWQDDPKSSQHVQLCYDAIDRIGEAIRLQQRRLFRFLCNLRFSGDGRVRLRRPQRPERYRPSCRRR
jgi:YD repeat-containing protein